MVDLEAMGVAIAPAVGAHCFVKAMGLLFSRRHISPPFSLTKPLDAMLLCPFGLHIIRPDDRPDTVVTPVVRQVRVCNLNVAAAVVPTQVYRLFTYSRHNPLCLALMRHVLHGSRVSVVDDVIRTGHAMIPTIPIRSACRDDGSTLEISPLAGFFRVYVVGQSVADPALSYTAISSREVKLASALP